jgi:group I intron endonuclease
MRKYGISNFKIEILEEVSDMNELDEKEKFYIKGFNSLVPNGYNLDAGGNKYKIITAETRLKISIAIKGKIRSPETKRKMGIAKIGNKNWIYGLGKRSHDSYLLGAKKAAEKNRGRKMSLETRKKMSIARSGKNHPFWGKCRSEETRKKISSGNADIEYIFINPAGEEIKIINLKRFCKERNLSSSGLFGLASGRISKYNSWIFKNKRVLPRVSQLDGKNRQELPQQIHTQ